MCVMVMLRMKVGKVRNFSRMDICEVFVRVVLMRMKLFVMCVVNRLNSVMKFSVLI